MNEIDLKLTNYSVIATRLGLTERRQIPDPMPFPHADPLGATTITPNICEPSESSCGTFRNVVVTVLKVYARFNL